MISRARDLAVAYTRSVLDTHGGADDSLHRAGAHVAARDRRPIRAARLAFVMEQHLGHRTYADNLRAALDGVPDLETHWIPVRYDTTSKWWERIPVEGVRSAWRGRTEVRRGLADIDVDVCVFNTQVPAMLGGRRALRTPYVLCMDDTPRLMDTVGANHYAHKPDAGPVGWAKNRYNRHILQNAAGLAPWSTWARASLIDDYGVDPSKIEVIPPGVDASAWQPAEHLADGPMKILFVGFDFERKGGEILLQRVRQRFRPGAPCSGS